MKNLLSTLLLLTLLPAAALSEDKPLMQHGNKMDHSKHMVMMNKNNAKLPVESGQDGFAAIAEIVKILSDDPKTDWSKVNINGLRNHLLAMNSLVTGAKVAEQKIAGGMQFDITGKSEVLSAIKQMVPAHANELNKMPDYNTSTAQIKNGIALTVTSNNKEVVLKIIGLGFFGLMATGSHHQAHHLGMATGNHYGMNH